MASWNAPVSESTAELQNALKERYEILRELGRGGMAVAYVAPTSS
jgi:hypothetical protein